MVLVKFRTVQAKLYQVNLPSDANISQAKEEVSKEINGSDPSQMKMIYKARVLSNDVPISSLNLGDQDFIVVNTPPSKVAKPAAPAPAPAEKPEDIQPLPTQAPAPSTPIAPDVAPLPIVQPAPQPGPADKAKFEEGVNSLTDIGFDRELAETALAAANGNVDLAAELIITGVVHGNENSGENSEDEAEPTIESEQPAQSVPDNADVPEKLPELPPELANAPQDQAAETLLAAFPQEEQDAIHRLQSLGNFNLLEVIQVYHACDKNEELAANILFSSLE